MPFKCPKKAKEYFRERYLAKHEEIRRKQAEYYKANSDSIKVKSKEYYQNNKDKVAIAIKKYAEENKEKLKEAAILYRERNKESLAKRSSVYGKTHRAQGAAANRRWRRNNPERSKEVQAIYRKNNKAKINNLTNHHRAIKLKALPVWANKKYIKLFYTLAKVEEKRTGRKVHVDHIVPLKGKTVCGLHCEHNLQLLFAEDNIRKNNSFGG